MDRIKILPISYETARKDGSVKNLELLGRLVVGSDNFSFKKAQNNLVTKARTMGGTHIFNTEHKRLTPEYASWRYVIVYGDVYGSVKCDYKK